MFRKISLIKNENGMTLIEGLCATVIITIVALSMLTLFKASANMDNAAKDYENGQNNAARAVENKSLAGSNVEVTEQADKIEITVGLVTYVYNGKVKKFVEKDYKNVTYRTFEKD